MVQREASAYDGHPAALEWHSDETDGKPAPLERQPPAAERLLTVLQSLDGVDRAHQEGLQGRRRQHSPADSALPSSLPVMVNHCRASSLSC